MYWLRSFRNESGAMPGMPVHVGSVHQIPPPVIANIITLQTTNKVIKSSRLRWAGHVVRMDDNELPKKILWTIPGGQRRRGLPKSRWIERAEEDAMILGCRN